MLKTALHTLDSWDLCHCTSRYNRIIIPGFLMEDSLHVHEQEAASCAPEFTRKRGCVVNEGLAAYMAVVYEGIHVLCFFADRFLPF